MKNTLVDAGPLIAHCFVLYNVFDRFVRSLKLSKTMKIILLLATLLPASVVADAFTDDTLKTYQFGILFGLSGQTLDIIGLNGGYQLSMSGEWKLDRIKPFPGSPAFNTRGLSFELVFRVERNPKVSKTPLSVPR